MRNDYEVIDEAVKFMARFTSIKDAQASEFIYPLYTVNGYV